MSCEICITEITDINLQCKNCNQKICENCLLNAKKDLKQKDEIIYINFTCFYCRDLISINITDNIEKYQKLVVGIINKLLVVNTELLNNCKNYKKMLKTEDELIEDAYYNDLIVAPS